MQVNNSVGLTPGSGVSAAFHSYNGNLSQGVVPVDEYGEINGRGNTFKLITPPILIGADKVFLDLFHNAGSTYGLRIKSVVPVVSGAVAESPTLGCDVYLTRTSAIGTGGTAIAANETDLTKGSIVSLDTSNSLVAGIDARVTPAAGATAGAHLGMIGMFTKVAPVASLNSGIADIVRSQAPIMVRTGTGIRLVSGSASETAGYLAFDVVFDIVTFA